MSEMFADHLWVTMCTRWTSLRGRGSAVASSESDTSLRVQPSVCCHRSGCRMQGGTFWQFSYWLPGVLSFNIT
jgi:hypothetical protein